MHREILFRTQWRDENAYRTFIGKPEGKRPCGDDNRMDLREIG
jgi:hypothetical protein